MFIKNKITTIFLLTTVSFYGQQFVNQQDSIEKREIKISYLDSIKSTFVSDNMASCIDSLWMKDLASLDVYEEMISDIKNVDVDQKVDYELPTALLKERLRKMDEKSPFNIEYNIGLENVIKSFLKNRKKAFERLLGISQFYFPLFEDELAKNNIPLEIKYLAVVESALNPRAVSRVGATGLWQFMYQTGKQYGLNIDSYVDDRSEPLKASQAASQYMNNMYKIFGDWDLVLAAYNSGPGNVAKAIRRSGGQQNYWNIRKNLPKETQGYLPAFLATMYIFEYHKEHGIVPNKAVANLFATDTVMIKNHMTFRQISDLLDIPVAEIQFFNPSFKRNEIPHITGQSTFLRLPKDKIAVFTSNEDKIYAYVQHEANKRERPYERIAVAKQKDTTNVVIADKEIPVGTKFHKVRRGENLNEIASKYNISIVDLKKWNNLTTDKAPRGKKLKILVLDNIASKEKSESKEANSINEKTTLITSQEIKAEKIYKTEKVVTFKDVIKIHKVKRGDNLGTIASKYDVSVAEIKKWNKLKGDNIGFGSSIKIIKNEKVTSIVKKEVKQPIINRKEDVVVIDNKNTKTEKAKKEDKIDIASKSENYYIVAKGDNLFTIAKKNNISIENIKEWNNLIDNNVKIGTQLIISGENIADSSKEDTKSEFKNIEHIVVKGEYLETLARKYNVSVKNILDWNLLSESTIKTGDKLIVGKEEVVLNTDKVKQSKKEDYASNNKNSKENLYKVRKGDTLLKITQKFPGVTIADIKKWNNIKGESIKPGMKLKING
jgi:membrane-bound lytic murein transglycosylase D